MFLNCHSYHSLRYGTISVEELVQQAANLSIKVLALTDINTITGIYEFHKLCKKNDIKAVVGVEVRDNDKLLYICLAKNKNGIGEINRLLTQHNCEGKELPAHHPKFKDVTIIYTLNNLPEKLYGNEYVGIRPEELNLLINAKLKIYIPKMVVLQPVTFKTKQEYNLHKILRAIDNNTLVTKLNDDDHCKDSERFTSALELSEHYQRYPEIIKNTEWILYQCNFEFEYATPRNKKFYTDSRENDFQLLTKLAYEGLKIKYGDDDEIARARVEKELGVIDQLNFSGYFLITWDIIEYSNRMGFMHVGRGSGANSIVSYCLGITDICPIELDLYFERFLNLNRKSPPDFDIDWSWQDRDTILQYIFDKYGKDHVAFCGTNVEFKYSLSSEKSAKRLVCRRKNWIP